jgi:LuxR family transcriptional regulator, regulator of acetate metabolism
VVDDELLDTDGAVRRAIEALLPERLQRMKGFTGLPVVFGGVVRHVQKRPEVMVSRTAGAIGDTLPGLVIGSGLGLGGSVLSEGISRCVDDYVETTGITHHYDLVVAQEGMTSVLAVPVFVRGQVHAILYGAVRDRAAIGDRGLQDACLIANQIQRDVERSMDADPLESTASEWVDALDELAVIIDGINDSALRARLVRIQQGLTSTDTKPRVAEVKLGPREVQSLRLVATGASNAEIAAEFGIRRETVKSYLRTAMQKLNASNRTAAVDSARRAGLL